MRGGPRRRRTPSSKPARRTRQRLWVLTAILGTAVAAALFVFEAPGPMAKNGLATEVVLPPKAGIAKIAGALAAAGVIRHPTLFIVAAEITGAAPHLKAGDYRFASRASMARVLGMIRDGAVVRFWVTIPEGLSSAAVAEVLARDEILSGPASPPPEGSLLPETYEVRRGETRAGVIARMQAARADLLDDLWAGRAANLPFKTPEEAVTLASIVEKETAKPDERPRIAAVFINRLRRGMRLETDPAVIYGLTGGFPLGHGLRVSELAKRTPYNTYLTAGLPPTPIANPGRAALIATLNPAATDALYFVADGAGGHVFAATFAEHKRNVAKWRAIERARNGRG